MYRSFVPVASVCYKYHCMYAGAFAECEHILATISRQLFIVFFFNEICPEVPVVVPADILPDQNLPSS